LKTLVTPARGGLADDAGDEVAPGRGRRWARWFSWFPRLLKTYFLNPVSSSVQNVLGLARPTTARRPVIWTSPSGDTDVTTPGSARLFPSLCAPTGELMVPGAVIDDRCGERTAMVPTRRRTRAFTKRVLR